MMSLITLFKAWPIKTIKLDLHRRQRRSVKYPYAGLHWRKVVHRVKRIKDLLHCPTIQKVNQKRRKNTLDHTCHRYKSSQVNFRYKLSICFGSGRSLNGVLGRSNVFVNDLLSTWEERQRERIDLWR